MQGDKKTKASGLTSLRQGSTDSRAVESYYDDWAETYDETLAKWHYQAPQDTCELLVPQLRQYSRILDVGCGTGLLAEALGKAGEYIVDGMDISAASLKLAKQRGNYASLMQHDLQDIPLPVEDDTYDAAASVGVLTYIEDAEALLRDLCRCVRAGGAIVFTQRSDLWAERQFGETIERLEKDGEWKIQQVSQPKKYLPGNEDFSDEIKVIHTLCQIS